MLLGIGLFLSISLNLPEGDIRKITKLEMKAE
jgi:hypothetical protein